MISWELGSRDLLIIIVCTVFSLFVKKLLLFISWWIEMECRMTEISRLWFTINSTVDIQFS